MKTTNAIGLENNNAKQLAEKLNELLANYSVFYQNTRGSHWNIKGEKFFELHVKFEELYNDAQLKIDLIAERVLTLEGVPFHTFSDYVANNKLPIGKNIHNDEKSIELIVSCLSELLKIERQILNMSAEIDDEGTNSMMSDFIAEQEKTIWMMKAWLA